ncbi:hypothetical protein MLAC_06570 [Mycobacterium lacus]|uniref:Major facilitator superfamily (MFS) profile domain-containing protein n=1 Tax=Mycobacterium lacus TaxID=169765 RepID=A0A7I7NGC0_9MYCO|nr:hypothetical protein MLAC_06570 [Mycobacterium lacus]
MSVGKAASEIAAAAWDSAGIGSAASPRSTPMPISPRGRGVIFVAIMLGMLVAALAVTAVTTALPTIAADLGGTGHHSWAVTSYLLSATSVIPLAGKLGDVFGRKRVLEATTTLFVVASVLCGAAQSMTMLVMCRALQGISGGVISVTVSALATEVAPLRHRGRYQGILGAVFGIATVTGPLVGGFFTDHVNWRWAFWVNVPVSLVILLVAATAIPTLAPQPKPVIDYLGIFLVTVGATGLTMATSWGGTTYAWGSPVIIGLLVVSAVGLGVFVWVERRVAAPILPIRLFRSRTFSLCCILAFGVGFAMLGALTVVPIYLRYVGGASATTSGLCLLPMLIGMLISSIGSGVAVSLTSRYKIFPVIGGALMATAFLLMSQMDESTPLLLHSVYLVILGAGIGMSVQLLLLITQNTTNFEDLGVATSSVTFFRLIGSSFGAAILATLFANFLNRQLEPAMVSSGAPIEVLRSLTSLQRIPPDIAALVVQAYRDSLTQVFLCAGSVALLGFMLACFLPEVPPTEIHTAPEAAATAPRGVRATSGAWRVCR